MNSNDKVLDQSDQTEAGEPEEAGQSEVQPKEAAQPMSDAVAAPEAAVEAPVNEEAPATPEAAVDVTANEVEAETSEAEAVASEVEAETSEAEAIASEPAAAPEEAPEAEEAEGVSDEEMFLAALNDVPSAGGSDDFLLTPVERGSIIKGMIASKTDSEILVDIGAKSEGVISGKELEELDQDTRDSLRSGEEIYVYVLTPEDRNGHAQLSVRRAMEEQDWRDAERYKEEGEAYRSRVASFNKGGLIVRFGKVRGFVPASQISRERRRRATGNTPDERWGSMVGEDIVVKVIEVDRGRNRLILSERAAAKEQRAERRAELLDSLEVGQIRKGRVISLADFGAFVDLGGADGLIHLSELSWRHVTHPKEVLKVGDEIEVEVIHIDHEKQRIGLSRKNRLEDPWDVLAANYHADQLVQGTITKLTKFGAFARLVDHPEIEGLIHISELSDRRVEHPREVVQEEEVVTLRIIRIDPEHRRMGLSLKRVDSEEYLDEDWREVVQDVNVDAPLPDKPLPRRERGKGKDKDEDDDDDEYDDYEDEDFDEDEED
jgi:small subunit ribosomal protein S1